MSRLAKAALLAVSLFAAGALAATIRGPADLATLARAADVVVRAKVISREAGWGAGDPRSGTIFTRIELEPLEQWKGEPAGARIAVLVAGGELGELAQQVAGTPVFAEREEVVVFLRKRASATPKQLAIYEVSHWALGKFSVGAAIPGAASSQLRAMRDRSGVDCVGCQATEQDVLPLDSLRAQVQAAVRR